MHPTHATRRLALMALCLVTYPAAAPRALARGAWDSVHNRPAEWYKSDEAVRIGDNVLAYQHPNGGWDKNIDMAQPLDRAGRERVRAKAARSQTLIDNGATHTQVRYLARVHKATGERRFLQGARRGVEFVLAAQYPNGGWPMIYPLRRGYYSHITYNDGSMVGVLRLLRDVAGGVAPFEAMPSRLRTRAARAVDRGVGCILATQVQVDGRPTAWCGQHDEETLAPAKARSYELPSLSGQESVGVVRFLMEVEKPSPEVVRAIEGAVRWFEGAKLTGLRVETVLDPSLPRGRDRVVVEDPRAGPLWARFYEIGTDRPMFVGRDGVVHDHLADIEHERRLGYSYLGDYAGDLLERDYPKWRERVARRAAR